MPELIDELKRFHGAKATVLAECQSLLDDLDDHEAKVRAKLMQILDTFQDGAERSHHRNEELVLHELRSTDAPIHPRISAISDEHRAFESIIAKLARKIADREVERAVLAAEVRWFVELYDAHATNEEAIFFPLATRELDDPAWQRLSAAWIR